MNIVPSALHLFTIMLSASLVYLLMVGLLQVKRTPEADQPSTFFPLDQLLSRTWFRSLCVFFGGIAAFLYGSIAFQGGALFGALKKVLAANTAGQLGGEKAANDLFAAVPDWLDPIFILVVFLLLFTARIRAPLLFCRDLIVGHAGLYSMVDEASLDAARTFIRQTHSYDGAAQRLETAYAEAPVPESLAGQRNEKRIAYQLIWHVVSDIRLLGPSEAFARARTRLALPPTADRAVHVDFALILAAAAIFFILMGVYVVVVPTFARFAKPHGLEWPNPSDVGWYWLIVSVMQNTLAFAVPLLLAVIMFPLRRRAYAAKESTLASFAIVAALQWTLAFLFIEVFNALEASYAYADPSHQAINQHFSFGMAHLHIGAFMYALCPVVAFLAWVKLRPKVGALWLAAAIVCAIVACSFFVCDVIYECYSGFIFYFWHQALLGLFITFAFFVAASLTTALEERVDCDLRVPLPASRP